MQPLQKEYERAKALLGRDAYINCSGGNFEIGCITGTKRHQFAVGETWEDAFAQVEAFTT